jgi:tRNA A-37 threonylcarbamoyl transferase component Bud32
MDKTHLDYDYLSTLKPEIKDTQFIFTVQNEIQQSIVSNNFPMFKKIYAEIAKAHADWICHIDETILSTNVLLNKNDKLQKLIEKYPLLEEFKKEFGLDMYD